MIVFSFLFLSFLAHDFFIPRLSHYIRVFGGRSVFGSLWLGSSGRVCNGVLFSFFLSLLAFWIGSRALKWRLSILSLYSVLGGRWGFVCDFSMVSFVGDLIKESYLSIARDNNIQKQFISFPVLFTVLLLVFFSSFFSSL